MHKDEVLEDSDACDKWRMPKLNTCLEAIMRESSRSLIAVSTGLGLKFTQKMKRLEMKVQKRLMLLIKNILKFKCTMNDYKKMKSSNDEVIKSSKDVSSKDEILSKQDDNILL